MPCFLSVTRRFEFCAGHNLPDHEGACRNIHGHNFVVDVTCAGPPKRDPGASDDGMVIEFAAIKYVWTEYLEPLLDHQYLNDTLGVRLSARPPTTEYLAAWLLGEFRAHGVPATAVDVWETPKNRATATWTVNPAMAMPWENVQPEPVGMLVEP